MPTDAAVQIVFVKWGRKYGPEYVNAMVEALLATASLPLKLICFTEHPEGLHPDVETRPFPDFGVPVESMTGRGGSLLKMSMFEKGQLEPGVPAIYLDLDSSVMGDIAPLVRCLERQRGLYLLVRHAIPHWRFRGLVRLLAPHRYYLGNTAVMALYPEDWWHIAEGFRRDFPKYRADPGQLDPVTRRLYDEGNERIISHAARDVSRVFPDDVAVKFTQGYMSHFLWLAKLRNRLPQVRARRARQAVISYHGDALKPEHLVNFREGDLVTYKSYKTIWDYPAISAYWAKVFRRA
ncbi:hypothetical protein [Oceaniglobus roseus]|uniref:hypothetical protein n=1 Tax=Oceaniglobus roseus TaxID=1737570 RepID=UPI000C7F779F|nr:hypothetical protein [Kandeliimicrobium roseum]